MKGKIWNRGTVICDWILLIAFFIFGVMYLSNNRTLYLIICIGSAIVMGINIKDYGIKWSFSFDESDSNTQGNSQDATKPVVPYPMESGSMNAVIGAIDKCCEFTAFCERYVIPDDRTRFKPGKVWCYIQFNKSNTISFGFTWHTDDSALKVGLKQQGYSLGEGFDFNDDSGFISFKGEIVNDNNANTYLANASENEVITELKRVAQNNYSSLGLTNHYFSGAMRENETAGWKSYEVTIE